MSLKLKVSLQPVTLRIQTPESQELQHAAEDEASGYSRIEDITPGVGKQDNEMREIKENGMTDEEFLNRYCFGNTHDLVRTVSFVPSQHAGIPML